MLDRTTHLLLAILLMVYGELFVIAEENTNEPKSPKHDKEIDEKVLFIDGTVVYKDIQIQLSKRDTIDCRLSESLNLDGIGINTIKDDLIKSDFIQQILLQNNFINSIPSNVFKYIPHLFCLNLASNKLDFNIDNPIEHQHLRMLNISYQNISSQDRQYIGASVSQGIFNSSNMLFPKLKLLDLSGNHISTLTMDFEISFPQLTHLYLKDNNLEVATSQNWQNLDWDIFFTKLPKSLNVLHLEENNLYEFSITDITNVTFLYLDGNPLGSGSFNIINNKLRVLSLSNCNLMNSYSQDSYSQNLYRYTRIFTLNTPYLKELDLSKNNLDDLPDYLVHYNHSLNTLLLNHNKISKIPLFSNAHGLLKLSLNYNNIHYITSSDFRHMRKLKQLSLKGNGLQQIEKDTFLNLDWLETLDLSRNKLKSLPNGWSLSLKNLVYLNLDFNQFATIMDVSVSTSTISLKYLFLKNNKLGKVTMTELATLPKSINVYV